MEPGNELRIQKIMVVDKKILFREYYFDGFCETGKTDYEKIICGNYTYRPRPEMEVSEEYKQPIAYCIIVNPELKKVFAYRRAKKDADYKEKRLQGRWSWGIGGHIDEIDAEEPSPLEGEGRVRGILSGNAGNNPIVKSMLRELSEEVSCRVKKYEVMGYINDDKTEVGKVHFGILYLVQTDSREVVPSDSEAEQGRLMSLREIEDIVSSGANVEEWSLLSLPVLEKCIKSL